MAAGVVLGAVVPVAVACDEPAVAPVVVAALDGTGLADGAVGVDALPGPEFGD